jgi:hypothetical protein
MGNAMNECKAYLGDAKPLLILNGEMEPNCPLGWAKWANQQAEEAYRKARAADRLKVMIAPGIKHQVTAEQHRVALEWLETWLK